MCDRMNETQYRPNKKICSILEKLFILHAEHELNSSTAVVRHLAASEVDIYSTITAGISALYSPVHGGTNGKVLDMLESIGTIENIPLYLKEVKSKKKLLYGFGHRIYKTYDPRAKIIKSLLNEAFEIFGKESLVDIAYELERQALADEYFIERNLYPNIDFYSGIIFKAMGFPKKMFPVLISIPRTAGWLAHWKEVISDPETKLVRPRQFYEGYSSRNYFPLRIRKEVSLFIH